MIVFFIGKQDPILGPNIAPVSSFSFLDIYL
jgi:hypothetical protein